MARSDTRYSVYPAPKAVEILGSTAPALNLAIECWATLLTRSIADNSRKFSKPFGLDVTGDYHPLHDWGMLAEALKDLRIDPEFPNPGALLATAIEDTHRLENLGWNWFHAEHLEGKWDQYESLREKEIKELLKKVQELDYPHAWALLLTVRWFWQHREEGVDIIKDEWWTLAFRRQWHQKHSGDKHRVATTDQQTKGTRRSRKTSPGSNV
jgi:hypothetical protein